MSRSSKLSPTADAGDVEDARDERRFRLLADRSPRSSGRRGPTAIATTRIAAGPTIPGLTREESSGTGWMAAVHPDDLDPMPPDDPGHRPGHGPAFRIRISAPAGRRRLPLAPGQGPADPRRRRRRSSAGSAPRPTSTTASDSRTTGCAGATGGSSLAATAARLGDRDWDIAIDTITWSESPLEAISGTPSPERSASPSRTSWAWSIPMTATGSARVRPGRRRTRTPYEGGIPDGQPRRHLPLGLVQGASVPRPPRPPRPALGHRGGHHPAEAGGGPTPGEPPLERKLADFSPAQLYILDLAGGNVLSRRGKPLQSLGSTPSFRAFDGQLKARLMHPDDVARFAAAPRRPAGSADGVDLAFEYRMRHRRRNRAAVPLPRHRPTSGDVQGVPEARSWARRSDITDQKHWQDELRTERGAIPGDLRERRRRHGARSGSTAAGSGSTTASARSSAALARAAMQLTFQDVTHPEYLERRPRPGPPG